jgi:radical SAM/Cys-rich protein
MVVPFAERLERQGLPPLAAATIETLQINVGKRCNQACRHCHVDASPARTEMMTAETADLVVNVIQRHRFGTVDITGGAPELNPNFRRLVAAARAAGSQVIDRCNLTILSEPGQEDLGGFLRDKQVQIVASLPYFLEAEVDRQRGLGIFEKSIAALKTLNSLGYAQPDSGLTLDLVYNPIGAYLPPPQQAIEADFKRELARRYGIQFNRLYTITNMPISRFRSFLQASGNLERYMEKLSGSFNPAAVEKVMCRTLVSVGWDGRLYDCDFNQMIDLELTTNEVRHIRDFDTAVLARRPIATANHCYGCTAGAGSSCGGATV